MLATLQTYITGKKRLRWAGHVARMEESRRVFKLLTGTLAGKRPLGKPGRRCEIDWLVCCM